MVVFMVFAIIGVVLSEAQMMFAASGVNRIKTRLQLLYLLEKKDVSCF